MTKRLRLKVADEHGDARLNADLVARLLSRLAGERDAAYVTIESDGPAFCDGLDLRRLVAAHSDVRAALDTFAALLRTIETTPRPVIALVGGAALGGGVGLAAAADVVLATPDATFGLPETLLGLIPATVLPVVARRVGQARARWLAVGARVVPAGDAWRFGLVDEVAEDLEAALARHAQRFERLDARAVGEAKAIAAALHGTPQSYHEDAAARFCRLLASPVTQGRIDRFLAGDTPWPAGGGP